MSADEKQVYLAIEAAGDLGITILLLLLFALPHTCITCPFIAHTSVLLLFITQYLNSLHTLFSYLLHT